MSKKTLALISGLVLVTVVLFVIALKSNQSTTKQTPSAMQPSPTISVAHSILMLSPNPVNVAPGAVGKVDVDIDASDNSVTAVQLELSFDPKSISNVQVVPGPLFQNGVILFGSNSAVNRTANQTGRFTFAVGKTPGQALVTGKGTVATISFTASSVAKSSQLTLLPTSLVTARGVATSVLKSSTGTQIIVGSGAGTALPQQSSGSARR